MLSVNVMAAPASAFPSGSVTVADSVTGSGSRLPLDPIGGRHRYTVSLPEPRRTVRFDAVWLPAGSVPSMVILLTPGASATLRLNVPSAPAVPPTDDPLAALRAANVVRAGVLPVMVTALPLTVPLFFGEETVIFGGELSNTYRTTGDQRTRHPNRRSRP